MPMQSTTERTVKTKFDGDAKDGIRAARAMERELKRLDREAAKSHAAFVSQTTRGADKVTSAMAATVKGVLSIGSAVSSAQGLAGATAAVATLAGTALALPGILAGAAAGGAVLKLAFSGIGDAISAKDLAEFNEVTKNMAPNAVKTAQAIRDQSGRLTDLKKVVQGNFFAGFDDDVRALGDKYFPVLNKQTGAIATEFNKMGREGAKALLDPRAVGIVNGVLGDTRDGLKELRPALSSVITGFLDLSSVGSKRIPAVGKAVNKLTQDFEDYIRKGVESGRINKIIDEGIATAKKFGAALDNVGEIGRAVWRGLGAGGADFAQSLVDSTQALEDFLESAEGQKAIETLGKTLRVTADVAREVFSTALRELGPIVTEIGPAVQEMARGIGDFLVAALQTVGPMLKNLAHFLSENKEVIGDLVPLLLGATVAYKGLRAAETAVAWIAGLSAEFSNMTGKANAAAGAVGDSKGGLVSRLGGLKVIAGTIALAAVAKELDDMNVAAAGSADKLSGVDEQLHNIVGAGQQLLSLDFSGISKEISDELAQIRNQFNSGQSPIGKLLNGAHVDLKITSDTSLAEENLKNLKNQIRRTEEFVTINGNRRTADQALSDVLKAIDNGEGTVNVNGNTIDSQRALEDLIGQINRSSGTVIVDGNPVPAGQVLFGLLRTVSGSRATMSVDADASAAQGVVNRFITMNNGRQVDIFVNARGDAGGLASAGRLATGGRPFFNGRVTGPGTPTSDTAGLFALSDQEHVWSAADVAGAGGHAAMYRLRALARQGLLRGFSDGGTPAFLTTSIPAPNSAPSVSVAAPNTTVTVLIDGQRFRGMIQTEIAEEKRAAKRVARSGPGGAW